MDIDRILATFNEHQVAYLLIGGVNFLLRHKPVTTLDIDLWVEDTPENLDRCEKALANLKAQWGRSEQEWGPVALQSSGWLRTQMVFCLMSPSGAIDIFRRVKGLGAWQNCYARAEGERTPAGVPYNALADIDMLQCQLALPECEQKQDRIRDLKQSLARGNHGE